MTIHKRLDKRNMERFRNGEIGVSAALELARMKESARKTDKASYTEVKQERKKIDKNVSESDTDHKTTKPGSELHEFSKFMPKPMDESVSDSDTEYGIEDVRALFKKNRKISTKDEKIIMDALTLLIEKLGGKHIEG